MNLFISKPEKIAAHVGQVLHRLTLGGDIKRLTFPGMAYPSDTARTAGKVFLSRQVSPRNGVVH